jgi:predicted dehydrogenase
MPRIVIVGARAARQGTGPFIAGALRKLGANVCAIVGTRASSVQQARQALLSEYDLHCRAYVDLPTALESETPDAVVICSPYQFHAAQLLQVARAGCHCLVEKPLAWPATQTEVDELLAAFCQRGLLLQVVNQWPYTLSSFAELHGSAPREVTDFAMRLSPLSIGENMVPDSAPHFLGMLQALLGAGHCEETVISFPHATQNAPTSELILDCKYRHLNGEAKARLLLKTCELRPRPAWYQINQLRADREVELPHYTQYLVSGEKRLMLPDPLHEVVQDFLKSLANHATTDEAALQRGHANLLTIAAALQRAR